jgi:FAD/FMN-containing dehydrogenase
MTGVAPSQKISAWGRLSAGLHAVSRPQRLTDVPGALRGASSPALMVGLRRSYGDVCLNAGGRLLESGHLDRFIAADWNSGVVCVEAGMSIDALLRVSVPKGWFIPVTPGTKFVTLGGAVANDVHGKNHHGAGTFGRFVRKLVIARSDGEIVETSRELRPDLFAATIGGLGLTGAILSVEFDMTRIASAYLDVETLPFANVDEFLAVTAASGAWPYTVAWADCFATGHDVGRGLFMRGRPLADGDLTAHGNPKLAVPFAAPSILLNPLSIRSFNTLYRKLPRKAGAVRAHYDGYFYPLDAIGSWNKLYGPRGFFQFQCVVPMEHGRDLMISMLSGAAAAQEGSFLIVLKTFGDLESPGVLSFPRPGGTLALDFPNKGESTLRLLARLNAMAVEAGGRIYPAKDATMTADQFRASYPRWREVEALRDPAIMSDFWRRVTKDAA